MSDVETEMLPSYLEREWPNGTKVRVVDPTDQLCNGMIGTVVSTKETRIKDERFPLVYVHLGADSGPDGWGFAPGNLERLS